MPGHQDHLDQKEIRGALDYRGPKARRVIEDLLGLKGQLDRKDHKVFKEEKARPGLKAQKETLVLTEDREETAPVGFLDILVRIIIYFNFRNFIN